ncbi:uncharacterized protein [Henckelia pumila]|uniref:uncharacterized protein isoform X2 n=1 Tax=Henckelia pumila TaxID=405737 RepID=UPI003C6E1AA6
MEVGLSGNALKTFSRSIICLARIGNELVLQASPSLLTCHTLNSSRSAYQSITLKPDFFDVYSVSGAKLTCHTLNSSRSAYQSITLKPDFFDVYSVSGAKVQCSVLLKAICSVLRTPIANIEHISVLLADPNSPKVQWTLQCFNGMRKTYWISCNVEPDMQQLSLDRRLLPSSFVVRPRDLNRILANFQSTLQEITIIATQPPTLNPNAADQFEGKAVEFRSYIGPTTENDSLLHTQLWIDPKEEFVQYAHLRDPVDVTFGVKELKAFLSFCEGCEVDIHIYFDKAGEPILMAPKFSSDDGSFSNFDATLVLATMLVSQLKVKNSAGPPPAASAGASAQQDPKGNTSDQLSDHTRIWSELSAKDGNGTEDGQVHVEGNQQTKGHRTIQRIGEMNISVDKYATGMPDYQGTHGAMEADNARNSRVGDVNDNTLSQRHPRNWVDAVADDDEEDEADLFVQSTPPYS